MEPYSLYLHIPFCRHRCAYCDFNTYAGLDDLIPAYGQALQKEIRWVAGAWQAQSAVLGCQRPAVHTIFFGGGTPSLLPLAVLEPVMATLGEAFDLLPGLELTLEANPGTLTPNYLSGLCRLGVNRISLGMQSSQPNELRLLERHHDFSDVVRSVEWCRQAGIANVNLDLIFGLPYQELPAWESNLDRALELAPEHISLYALSLEHGTPMAHWVQRGLLPEPDSDQAADMYELASDRLGAAGFLQYEISNWARKDDCEAVQSWENPALACRHNLQYWRNQPYLGFGAGAHGYAAGSRTANLLSPAAYIQRLGETANVSKLDFPRTPATAQAISIDQAVEMGETMIMGLRLTREGVSSKRFQARFGSDLEAQYGEPIQRLIDQGLLEWARCEALEDRKLRLSQPGRLLGNRVFLEFI
jgi:oxygen-independent coproporphyrinogen-3 oxidase